MRRGLLGLEAGDVGLKLAAAGPAGIKRGLLSGPGVLERTLL